jgi:hypothetical protein
MSDALVALALLLGAVACAGGSGPARDASVERTSGVDAVANADAIADSIGATTDLEPDGAATPWDADGAAPWDADSAALDTAPDLAGTAPGHDGGMPSCTGICNSATPRDPTVDGNGGTGNVTMYTTEASNGGACNYGATSVRYFAAVNVNVSPGDGQGQWKGGRICGQCAEVTALTSQGPRSVVLRIMDRCPDASCGMDLGGDAPAAIMLDGFGRYDGSWRFVACTGHPEVSDGAPSLFVVTGSNAWWSRVQVRNPPWPVTTISWADPAGTAAGAFPFAADPENTFAVPAEALQASAATLLVTVTYADGSTATARLAPADLASPGTSHTLE